MAVKKEGKTDVIHAGCFHHKMVMSTGVLQDFFEPFVVIPFNK
jgi:hypothetical protein